MKQEILARLSHLEQEEGVRILYACESGSRAWGFPSTDSDYDVRFIYLQPQDWYLSIDLEKKRDVIERPINDQIDLNGWDLRKALWLYRKSNPPLLEWLGSPIIYLEKYSTASQLRTLAPEYYSPKACMYHYLHMARGNYREYLKGERVWIKKYFYILRPLLAINWLEKEMGIVPTEFRKLVNQVVGDRDLKQEIETLIKAKEQGAELDYGPRIPAIGDFIDREIARLENQQFTDGTQNGSAEELNRLFRSALDEVWS
jgi:hypothetical protein